MSDGRNLLGHIFGPKRREMFSANPPAPEAAPEATTPTPPQPAPFESLQSIGRDAEELLERTAQLSMRFEDLMSLRDEFTKIADPLDSFIREFAISKRKISEMNSVIARQDDLLLAARADQMAAERNATQLTHDLRTKSAKLQEKEAFAEQMESTIAHYRALLEEKTSQHDMLDRELFAASEKIRALSIESQALKSDVASITRSGDEQTRRLKEFEEKSGILEDENGRLLKSVESLSSKGAELQTRLDEVTQKYHAERQELSHLQAKLHAEQQAFQKAAEAREQERSAFQREIASLQLKVETTTNRLTATEKLLAHMRAQAAADKDALRVAESAAKDAIGAKAEAERLLSMNQDSLTKQTAALHDSQQLANELRDKVENFTKLVAAKEVLVETAIAKATNLESRLEQVTHRYESERTSSEAAFRRVLEELQNERAERLLLQGALDIARSGRSKLLSEIAALKRKSGGPTAEATYKAAEQAAAQAEESAAVADNVRAFKMVDRDDEKRSGASDRGGARNGDAEEAFGARK